MMAKQGLLLAALLALAGAGCGPGKAAPKTYAVKGKVVYKDKQPVKGGTVHFESTANSSLHCSGEIQPDGTFTLTTLVDNQRLPGAVEGAHKVTVILPQGEDQAAPSVPLPQPVTVKPDDTNDFTLTIDRPARRP